MKTRGRLVTTFVGLMTMLWAGVPAHAAQSFSSSVEGAQMYGNVVYWLDGKTFVVDGTVYDNGVPQKQALANFVVVSTSGNVTYTQYWNTTGGYGSSARIDGRIDRPNNIAYIIPKACLGTNQNADTCSASNPTIDNPHT